MAKKMKIEQAQREREERATQSTLSSTLWLCPLELLLLFQLALEARQRLGILAKRMRSRRKSFPPFF